MTLIKWNNETKPVLGNLFEDFFNWNFPVTGKNFSSTSPAVNISENKEGYSLEVAAPGLKKEDFKVDIDNNTLTISSEIKSEKEEKDERYTRREFSYSSFKRSFYLPETVSNDKISAKYENGVLNIFIPKKEVAKEQPVRTIKIS